MRYVSYVILLASILLALAQGAQAQHASGERNSGPDPLLWSYEPATGIEGRLAITGSNTMYPIMSRLAAEFKRYYPAVHIGVEGRGSQSVQGESSSGLSPFWQMVRNYSTYRRGDGSDDGHHVSMQMHIMASSRKLTKEELATFTSRHGYEPLEMPIAVETVAVYVHRDNPLQGLTLDQVDAIFSQTPQRGLSKEVKTWGQLGLNDGWKDAPVRLYGRDQQSGTQAFFKQHVLLDGNFRSTLKEVPGSATLILEVSRDPYSIGYSGIGYQSESVRALPLSPKAGMPFVAPSFMSAKDGSYPLIRNLYLYVNNQTGDKRSPVVSEFLKFINSREGQEAVVKAGVYALPIAQIQENIALLNGSTVTAANRSRK